MHALAVLRGLLDASCSVQAEHPSISCAGHDTKILWPGVNADPSRDIFPRGSWEFIAARRIVSAPRETPLAM